MDLTPRFFAIALLVLSCLLSACDCGDDDPSSGSGQAQADDDQGPSADDDASADDDDDSGDDDAGDDDSDDDAADDDSGDDDADDDSDDDDDNDSDDDDDDNDDDNDDDDNDVSPGDLVITQIDGGAPGNDGSSLVVAADGTIFVATAVGRRIVLFTVVGDAVEQETIVEPGIQPWLALDPAGRLHVAYIRMTESDLMHGVRNGAEWTFEVAFPPIGLDRLRRPRLLIDADGFGHISATTDYQTGYYYLTNRTGAWQEAEDLPAVGSGEESGMAVDAAGAVWFTGAVGYDLQLVTNAGGAWTTEVIEADVYSRAWSAVAVDVAGRPHVIYENRRLGTINYAVRADTGWVFEVVESDPGYGDKLRFALGAAGAAHAVYVSAAAKASLRYATNAGGSWTSEEMMAGDWPALGLDLAGQPVAAFHDPSAGSLRLARRNGSWSAQTLAEGGDRGWYPSIALDAAGARHIAYYDMSGGQLLHATDETGSWVIDAVDATDHAGRDSATAVDPDGALHVVYTAADAYELRHAVRDAEGWKMRKLGDDASIGMGVSLVIDAGGLAHIAYCDLDGLKYAVDDGVDFTWTLVEAGWRAGWENSLALDSEGAAHLAYSYWSFDPPAVLRYATNRTGEWVKQTVDNSPFAGWYLSLGLDSDDRPEIAYQGADEDLRFAAKEDAGWGNELVDWGADGTGFYVSLAMAGDAAHLVYTARFPGTLKYATNQSGTWRRCALDWGIDTGWYPALARGPGGWLHAAYYGEMTLYLASFPLGHWW